MAPTAFLHPFARPAADEFTTIVRGQGAAVWDATGRRYVDAIASLWYCQVGHGRQEIAEAVATQLRSLEAYHCFERFTNEPAERFAAEVVAIAPMDDARVFLVSSGSEAVDTALKLVRVAMAQRGEPHRHRVVARTLAYHGVTYGGLTAQGLPLNQEGFGPLLPGVERVDHADLAEVADAFTRHGDEIAAVIAEPVLGAGGVHPPAPGYLEGLRRLCDEHGAYLVLDEVICGFGRLGSWWGAEHYGVTPDLVTFAKGASSGYLPLGGVLVGPAVREPLEADERFLLRHGHTYSGHPTCCAAGSANLRILAEEELPARAGPIGHRLGAGLAALHDEGLVAAVRGVGAIWAVDVPEGADALEVRDGMLGRGVIARPIGTRTIAFCPPLVIGDDDLDRCLDALGHALRDGCRHPRSARGSDVRR